MKKKIQQIVIILASLVMGVAIGISIMTFLISYLGEDFSFGEYMLYLCGFLLLFYAVYFVHIIAHEAGHLIFGLLTGYKFCSFRIGSAIIVKEDGKYKLKNYSLAGTGGQCLMAPPEMREGKVPYVLYNFGGVIINLIIGAVCLVLFLALPEATFLSVALIMSVFIGFFTAATNGIPMQTGLVSNDGYNALSLGKDEDALRSFYCQLKVNEYVTKGVRLRDVPEELFVVRDGASLANPLNNTMLVFTCNRLIDEHRFAEARFEIEKLLGNENVLGVHKNMLVCDLVFCKLLVGEAESAANMLDKGQKRFMAAMAKNPSILRTWYSYALLFEKDEAKAKKYKADFEKNAAVYPYKGDIESERELMLAAEEKAAEKEIL
ncbi:MAG: M50 family metallopeptidase [Clostridia bacterium]|nr:M50 family metallopeptidase [Clostridia bacterium]